MKTTNISINDIKNSVNLFFECVQKPAGLQSDFTTQMEAELALCESLAHAIQMISPQEQS